jgi:hypothetical protein
VPDALFCHKCGRPTRELPVVETAPPPEPEVVETPPPPPPATPPPGFGNPVAIKTALAAAAIGTLPGLVPYLNFLVWPATGMLAVFLYVRQSGQRVNVASGMRIGWMTGVILFAIMLILITLSLLFIQAAGGIAAIQSQFKGSMDPRVAEGLKAMQSGPAIVGVVIQLFITTTLLSMGGGAVASAFANISSRRRR